MTIPLSDFQSLFKTLRPFGIDLCSGVERMPGRKDPNKLSALIDNFKHACEAIQKEDA